MRVDTSFRIVWIVWQNMHVKNMELQTQQLDVLQDIIVLEEQIHHSLSICLSEIYVLQV